MRASWLAGLAALPASRALKGGVPPTSDPSQTVIVEDDNSCPDYSSYAYGRHEPISPGRYSLSYQRPYPACRTFNASEVEETIHQMARSIRDPDLFRLFENCFPNTLDTAITWRGHAKGNKHEELTFITTGDINAMWLRDSANQLQTYLPLLRPSPSTKSLASLFRGAINLQARYILAAPHCNAFHAPPEATKYAKSSSFSSGSTDYITPAPDPSIVFECKYELDSLAAFLQLSHDYHSATDDTNFFSRFHWLDTVDAILNMTSDLLGGTYNRDGSVAYQPYIFQRTTNSAYETLGNAGVGAPVKGGTGMVRSAFRPSDDACLYQLFVPANMMFSRYLGETAGIAERLGKNALAKRMRTLAGGIRQGIEKYGRVNHRRYGKIYAYEVDGYGSYNAMDDANIPSLLSMPLFGFVARDDPIYQNTRRFVLSKENPYYMFGPVINGYVSVHAASKFRG
ncbi:hypothetical protein OQA88_9618 [Cercophora sp. LCS_1]